MDRKVALITGSGKKRIGRAVAMAAAANGYNIALHYHSSAADAENAVEELQAKGVRAEAFRADITKEEDVERLTSETLKVFGRIDLLVTCAAVWEPKKLELVTADVLRRNIDVNMMGTFFCCQKAGLAMTKQPEGGCIVTIGDWATEKPYLNYAAYFAAKGSIPVLTRVFAIELAQRNPRVRVNCVLPGPVMVPDSISAEEKKQIAGATLLKRLGKPENIAETVLFFAANEFITGVCLPVDGGRTIASF
jgi:pteridine reductase